MKKLLTLLVLFSIISSNIPLSLAKSGESDNVLTRFKKKEFRNIFDDDNFIDGSGSLLISSAKKIDLYSSLKQNVEEKRKELEKQNSLVKLRLNSLEKTIEYLDNDIKQGIDDIEEINTKISELKKDVKKGKIIIDLIQKRIKSNKEVLLEYLEYIYKKSNSGFDGKTLDNLKSMILDGTDSGTFMNEIYYSSVIRITGQKLIDKHRKYLKALYLKKLELEENEEKQLSLRKDLFLNKKNLEEKRAFKKEILTVTKGKEELLRSYIKEKLKAEKGFKLKELKASIIFNTEKNNFLKKYDCEGVDVMRDKEKLATLSERCQDVNKLLNAETILQKKSLKGNNPFLWPVSPERGLTAFFRDSGYRAMFGDDHDAIDIRVHQGTRIKAPADGYVVYIEEPKTADYSYVAIKHSNGFVTVYGHLSKVMVKKYDYIRRGQVFAESGGEYGTKGAGFLSTGPHLHFEVIHNKEFADPLNYLDLSYTNLADLQSKYKYKFFTDFKNKFGYDYSGATGLRTGLRIVGLTETERQKSLLKTYASGGFKDWDMWVDEATAGNIDPTFVMCIGLAETTLGKNFKTGNNIGNVGNTDSGATKTMSTPRSGVKSIVQTLNNKYLGHYKELKDLSRYGNKTGSIYASSEENWHNNMIKCMSIIKQKYVFDDYNFRLNQK